MVRGRIWIRIGVRIGVRIRVKIRVRIGVGETQGAQVLPSSLRAQGGSGDFGWEPQTLTQHWAQFC